MVAASGSTGGGGNATGQLMYRSVVGYLGTIEMPEDSGGSSQSSPGSTSGGLGAGMGGSAAARLAAIRYRMVVFSALPLGRCLVDSEILVPAFLLLFFPFQSLISLCDPPRK